MAGIPKDEQKVKTCFTIELSEWTSDGHFADPKHSSKTHLSNQHHPSNGHPADHQRPSNGHPADHQRSCVGHPADHQRSSNGHPENQQRPSKPNETNSTPTVKEEKLWKSVLCGLAICMGSFGVGSTVAYASPAIPNLNRNPNPFHMNPEQTSWVAICALAAILGGFIGGQLMDKIGRKLALMSCAGPFALSWVVIVASPNFLCMMVGRALTGVGVGLYSVICPNYLGEIAPASIRGLMGSCHQLSVCSGILYVYVLGAFLPWTWLAIACSAVNLALVVALSFIPETPRWLLSVGRLDDAEFALKWLRGEGTDLRQELERLQKSLRNAGDKAAPREFLQPQLLKPLLVSLGLMAFQQFSGVNVIVVFTVQIFQKSKSSLDANVQTIVVGIVGVVGTLVSAGVSDWAGRKVLLMVSGVVMTLTMGGMGAFFYMLEEDEEFATSALAWLPMACLVVFNFGFNVAFGPIPWLIMSELFPLRAKGVASGISTAFNWLLAFVVTKFFINVTNAIHPYGAYWICAGFCALSLPFIVFFVPETKGKSLEEIQKSFT